MNSKLCLVSTGGDMSKRGMGDKNTVYVFFGARTEIT